MSIGLETKEQLFEVMGQIAAEREAARPIVEKLVSGGEPADDIEIPEAWRTAGMVLELASAAFAKNESQPMQSLELAQLGFAISTSIHTDTYPATLSAYLLGRTWREIGFAHRYLCAYKPAIEAFTRAECAFSADSALVQEEAAARFARGNIHFIVTDYEKCSSINATARDVFRSVGDKRRLTMCEVVDASIAYRRGDFEIAKEKYEKALSNLWDSEDLHTIGIVHNNLGHVYRMLMRTNDAVTALEHAREIFVHLEMPSEVNRADWGVAVVILEKGDPLKALPMLRRLREDYLRRQMWEEAAEVGLCIVDALVALDEVGPARALTEQVCKEFAAANLTVGATTALSYLRDLIRTVRDLDPAIRHVRSYFESLRLDPNRVFVPPDQDE